MRKELNWTKIIHDSQFFSSILLSASSFCRCWWHFQKKKSRYPIKSMRMNWTKLLSSNKVDLAVGGLMRISTLRNAGPALPPCLKRPQRGSFCWPILFAQRNWLCFSNPCPSSSPSPPDPPPSRFSAFRFFRAPACNAQHSQWAFQYRLTRAHIS